MATKKPINRRSFQREGVLKIGSRKIVWKSSEEFSTQKEALLSWRISAASTTRCSKSLGGPPPQDLLSSSIQHGLDAAFQPVYLVFLLDIRHSLGLCPLKIWGPSQAKWIKASSVLIWRTMAETIHDSRPSIWTSPHNRLRSQIPFLTFPLYCIFLKET